MRDIAAEDRHRKAEERDAEGHTRHDTATERNHGSDSRDQAAEHRDREAETRDRDASRLAAEHATNVDHDLQASGELGIAIGILVEQSDCTPEQALATLSERSGNSDVGLRQIAKEMVDRHRR